MRGGEYLLHVSHHNFLKYLKTFKNAKFEVDGPKSRKINDLFLSIPLRELSSSPPFPKMALNYLRERGGVESGVSDAK